MNAARMVGAALVVLLGAYWAVLPVGETAVLGVPVPGATELTGQATGPIAYGYRKDCGTGGPPPCGHWHLVGADGRRWWIPDVSANGTTLEIGRDVIAYQRQEKKDVAVRNLRTGAVHGVPGAADGLSLSLDDRHLAVRAGEKLTVYDLTTGDSHETHVKGTPAGWTAKGVLLTRSRPSDNIPGHLWAAELTEITPNGTRSTRPVPSNLATHPALSPDGTTLAVTAATGVHLVDAPTGKITRTVPVRSITSILTWQDATHLIVGTSRKPGGYGSPTSYHVLALTTGTLRDLPIDDAPAVPGTLSVSRVRQ